MVGVALGPAVFGLVTAHDQIDLLAQVGVAVLLFVVGLKLDLHHLRHVGPVALATGIGQLVKRNPAILTKRLQALRQSQPTFPGTTPASSRSPVSPESSASKARAVCPT